MRYSNYRTNRLCGFAMAVCTNRKVMFWVIIIWYFCTKKQARPAEREASVPSQSAVKTRPPTFTDETSDRQRSSVTHGSVTGDIIIWNKNFFFICYFWMWVYSDVAGITCIIYFDVRYETKLKVLETDTISIGDILKETKT